MTFDWAETGWARPGNSLALGSGRQGLSLLARWCRDHGIGTLLAPAFCCVTMLTPFWLEGLSVRPSAVDERLVLDARGLRAARAGVAGPVAVLVARTGGSGPDEALLAELAVLRRRGDLVIDDATHAVLADLLTGHRPDWCDASVASLRKLLPVPDGALLRVREGMELPEPAPAQDSPAQTLPTLGTPQHPPAQDPSTQNPSAKNPSVQGSPAQSPPPRGRPPQQPSAPCPPAPRSPAQGPGTPDEVNALRGGLLPLIDEEPQRPVPAGAVAYLDALARAEDRLDASLRPTAAGPTTRQALDDLDGPDLARRTAGNSRILSEALAGARVRLVNPGAPAPLLVRTPEAAAVDAALAAHGVFSPVDWPRPQGVTPQLWPSGVLALDTRPVPGTDDARTHAWLRRVAGIVRDAARTSTTPARPDPHGRAS